MISRPSLRRRPAACDSRAGAPPRRLIGLKVGGFASAHNMNLIVPISMAATLLKLTPLGAANDITAMLNTPSPSGGPVECPVDQGRESTNGIVPSSGEYSVVCSATPGYRIVKADLMRASDNNLSDVRITTTPDGAQVVMSFRLTSGPIYDRWRGWLNGKIVMQQEKR